MNNVAQYSDISLKQSVAIEDADTGNCIVNDWVDMSGDGQTGLSSKNRFHTSLRQTLSVSRTPLLNVNVEDKGIYRHWSPVSQKFVGGDTLITTLDSGWKIAGNVLRQKYSCISNRCAYVYHLELHRHGERSSMKVVENPLVTRLLHQLQVEFASDVSPEL